MSGKMDLESLSLIFPVLSFPKTAALLLLVIAAAVFFSCFHSGSTSIPLFKWDSVAGDPKTRWMFDSMNLLHEGYNQFYDRPFQVWTPEGNQVSLPGRHVEELKMLPDHLVCSTLRESIKPDYTLSPSIPFKDSFVSQVIKQNLGKVTPKIIPMMREEVDVATSFELPDCNEWAPVPLYPTVLRLVSRVSGRVFVGNGLNRNEEWIRFSCTYTRDLWEAASAIKTYHPILRLLVARFLPSVRRVWAHNVRAQELLGPVLNKRAQEETQPGWESANDAVQWVRELLSDAEKKESSYQTVAQLGILVVSTNGISQLITNIIFNLAAYPEYVPVLREEIDTVLRESGGEWTLDCMGKLKKMDSFMKETLRYNAPASATFQRRVLQGITLSDGTYLPPGTRTFSPASAIAFDPSIYEEPEAFDGLRFYRTRQSAPENENKYLFTSTSKTQMQFGRGRHACPGRWFASHMVKLMVAKLIQDYDLRFKEGERRPKNILKETRCVPDRTASVCFRRREV